MRRLLRDVAENRPLGDTTTLADPTVVEEIKERSSASAAEEVDRSNDAAGARVRRALAARPHQVIGRRALAGLCRCPQPTHPLRHQIHHRRAVLAGRMVAKRARTSASGIHRL